MFGAKPVAENDHVFDILEVNAGDRITVGILSESLEGVYTHYSGRTLVCPGKECPICTFGRTPRFLGFIVVQFRERKRLLRLTANCALRMLADPPSPGQVFELTRKSKRATIQATFRQASIVSPDKVVSKMELLNCLAHLFCLGGIDFAASYESQLEALQARALLVAQRAELPLHA